MTPPIYVSLFACLVALCNGRPESSKYNEFLGSTDPEIWMNATQIINRWGYPAEEYDVTTDDGYILAIQRLPRPGAPVVFLQHGLECSSTNWITNLPTQSAAYIFFDAGYDVWLGNFRGNTYGRRSVNYTVNDKQFWKFSWDEMAAHDLPAMINYVLHKTSMPQLYYVGHSEGTMTAFVAFSQNKQLASKIKHYYALAPVATVKHVSGALKWIAPFTGVLSFVFNVMGVNEFLPNNWVMDELVKYACFGDYRNPLCDNILFLITGPNSHQLNNTRLPVYFSHTPAGTSSQNVVHFGQMVGSGKFCKYDFGKRDNMKHYGQSTPPVYDLKEMHVPVWVFWGDTDALADPSDVHSSILTNLPNITNVTHLHDFSHMDFIWGLNATSHIYMPILNHMNSMEYPLKN